MRSQHLGVLVFLLVLAISERQLAAQEPVPRSQFTLDAGLLAGGLSYARTTSSHKLVGVGGGAGAEFNIRLVSGQSWGAKSTEVLHVEMFTRREAPRSWQYDLGVKAAADVHTARVASEAEFGGFLGGYIAPMWGWRHFRIGPRVQAGLYWTSPQPSFGISITPLTARFLF